MKQSIAVMSAALVLALAPPALAQNARSFVSGQGNDANTCTLASPCRTLQRAHDQTNAGGEIDVLNPAGYGALVINKAISVVNDGVGTAGVIVASGGTGILINAGVNDAVNIRGLTVEGGGVGKNGIQFNTGKSLTVENCIIRHVTLRGIRFLPNAASRLSVSNSLVADNGDNGIEVIPVTGSGTVTAIFNRVQTNNNANNGIEISGDSGVSITASVYDSVSSGNGNSGFVILTFSGAPAKLMVFRSASVNNGFGVFAQGAGAILRIASSLVTGNGTGWTVNGAVVQSYGNNSIDGNASGEAAPPTAVQK